mgnify:CR=1 FL=1
MSRTIPAPLLASTTAAQLNPFFATSLDFDAGSVRYWTGYGTITIGAVTYAGLGAFSSISTRANSRAPAPLSDRPRSRCAPM